MHYAYLTGITNRISLYFELWKLNRNVKYIDAYKRTKELMVEAADMSPYIYCEESLLLLNPVFEDYHRRDTGLVEPFPQESLNKYLFKAEFVDTDRNSRGFVQSIVVHLPGKESYFEKLTVFLTEPT